METTLVLIKPGGVSRNLIGEITRRIEARNLKISGLKLMNAERATVEAHYAEHSERPFFKDVCDYLVSGPVVAIAVTGTNSVKAIRAMMGATNPVDAAPGTVRGDLALTILTVAVTPMLPRVNSDFGSPKETSDFQSDCPKFLPLKPTFQ
jgi:nucleoside-diphosphate kinase